MTGGCVVFKIRNSPEDYSDDEGKDSRDDHEPLPCVEAACVRMKDAKRNEAEKDNGEAIHQDCDGFSA